MALTVRFFKNVNKKTNSTFQPSESNPSTYVDYTCTLKDGTSILDPVLDIYITMTDNPASMNLNYCKIASFNRYYFVDDWKYTLGVWTAYCHVDVLASYKTDIGSYSPYLLRAAAAPENDQIADTMYPAKTKWASLDTSIPDMFDDASSSYIIGIISPMAGVVGANNLGSVNYYYATKSEIVQLVRYLMSTNFVDTYMKDESVGLTANAVKDFVDPLQYISSLTYFPFIARSDSLLPSVRPQFGWWDTSNDNNIPQLIRIDSLTKQFTGNTYSVAIPVNPYSSTAGKAFLKHAPYTEYLLRFEPFGTISLNTDLIVERTNMYLSCDVDLVSGFGRLSVGTTSGGAELGTYTAMVGVPISISQVTQDLIQTGLTAAQTVLNTAGNLLTGNFGGAISNVISGVRSGIESMKPELSSKSATGCLLPYQGLNTGATLIMRYVDCVNVDPADLGYAACYKATSISALGSGYVLCGTSDINVNCTRTEKMEIQHYLTGGFFYE
jgi:hypothetical protein